MSSQRVCHTRSVSFARTNLKRELVRKQDQLFKKKHTSATNALLGPPREYSLLQSNCQHFILELTRRIDMKFDTEALEEQIVRDSLRPRALAASLSMAFAFISTLFLFVLSGFLSRMITYLALSQFHIIIVMAMWQDYKACNERIERLENEWRYLGTRDYRGISWLVAKPNVYRPWAVDFRFHIWYHRHTMCGAFFGMLYGLLIGFYFLSHLGAWATIKMTVAICLVYGVFFGTVARFILTFLKSEHLVTQLSKDEKRERVKAAMRFVGTHYDYESWRCIRRKLVRHPDKRLKPLGEFAGPGVYKESFGARDLLEAIIEYWGCSDGPCLNERLHLYIAEWNWFMEPYSVIELPDFHNEPL